MFTTRTRLIAMMLAFALPMQPVVALPFVCSDQAVDAPPTLTMPPTAGDPQPMPLPCSPFVSVMLVPIGVVPATALEDQRHTIADQLVSLGYEASIAQQMASQLTPDDLAVLLDNPKMMQKAGEMDELTKNIIWALVIAGIVVAIVIAADGSITMN